MVKVLVIFFGGFFVFIAGGLLIEVINRKQNKQKMQQLAGKLGFNFCERPSGEVLETLKGSDLFHWGGNLRSLNWIAGDYCGVNCFLFQRYFAFIISGTSCTPYNQTVAVVSLKQCRLPRFSIHSKKGHYAFGGKKTLSFVQPRVNCKEIIFSEDEKFISRYRVYGINEDDVKKALPQSTIDLLGNSQDDWHVEAEGGVIAFYLINELWDDSPNAARYMEAISQIAESVEK